MFKEENKYLNHKNLKYFLSQLSDEDQNTFRQVEQQSSKRKLTIDHNKLNSDFIPSNNAISSSLNKSKSNKGIELLEKVEENLRMIRKDIEKMNTISVNSKKKKEEYNNNKADSESDNEIKRIPFNSLGHNDNYTINYQEEKPLWIKKNHSMASIYSRNSNCIGNNRDNTPPYLIK